MKEGFYWIQYKGLVQIALFLTGNLGTSNSEEQECAFWLITGGLEVDHCESIKVVNGPLDIRV